MRDTSLVFHREFKQRLSKLEYFPAVEFEKISVQRLCKARDRENRADFAHYISVLKLGSKFKVLKVLVDQMSATAIKKLNRLRSEMKLLLQRRKINVQQQVYSLFWRVANENQVHVLLSSKRAADCKLKRVMNYPAV